MTKGRMPPQLEKYSFKNRPENIGRKKEGSYTRKTLLKKACDEAYDKGGRTRLEAIADSMVNQGIMGDVAAAKLVFDNYFSEGEEIGKDVTHALIEFLYV